MKMPLALAGKIKGTAWLIDGYIMKKRYLYINGRHVAFHKEALVLLVCVLALSGCVTPNEALVSGADLQQLPVSTEVAEYRIHPGDELDIKFFYNPELNETVVVRPDGKISLQLVDEIQAAALTPAELDASLTRHYATELKDATLSVIVRSFTNQRIYVGGEVNRPSLVSLISGMTPLQAVLEAGGLKDTANLKEVLVVKNMPPEGRKTFVVDLQKTLFGREDASAFQLQSGDIVFVPKSGIAKANLFTDQYIRKLLMFDGIRFGVGYDIDDD